MEGRLRHFGDGVLLWCVHVDSIRRSIVKPIRLTIHGTSFLTTDCLPVAVSDSWRLLCVARLSMKTRNVR
jgi:hypothetical protein